MVVAILSTNFLIATKLLGKAIKEGLANPEKKEEDKKVDDKKVEDKKVEDKKDEQTTPVCYDPNDKTKVIACPVKNKSEKFTTLSPASIHEGEDSDHKVDYASTLESAYDNLDKLLGSEAIRTMTQDTQRLAEKQQVLMGNIKQLQPMMQNAGKMLDGLNVGQMGDMLTNLEEKFKKFSGSGTPKPA